MLHLIHNPRVPKTSHQPTAAMREIKALINKEKETRDKDVRIIPQINLRFQKA
jgi:hypothetical protein